MPNNNGDFLSCMREVEEELDSEDATAQKRAMRKIGTHIIRMHQQIEEIVQSHTDENGKLYDMKGVYGTLQAIVEEMKDMRKLLWTAQIGVYLFGALAPIVIGVAIYQFNLMRRADEVASEINLQQTIALERVQTIQQSLMQQLSELRNHKGE